MPKVLIADRSVETVEDGDAALLRILIAATSQRAHWDLERGIVAVGSALTGVRVAATFPEPANAGVDELRRLLTGMLSAVGARHGGAEDAAICLRVFWTRPGEEDVPRVRARYRGLPGGPAWTAARHAVGFGLQWPIERGTLQWDLGGGLGAALRFHGTVELDVAVPPRGLTAENAHEWADALYALLLAAAGEERSVEEVSAVRRALLGRSGAEVPEVPVGGGEAPPILHVASAGDEADAHAAAAAGEDGAAGAEADAEENVDAGEGTGDVPDEEPAAPPPPLVWRVPAPVAAPAAPGLHTFRPAGGAAPAAARPPFPAPAAAGAPAAPASPAARAAHSAGARRAPLTPPLPPGAAPAPRGMGTVSSYLQPGERRRPLG
ncbi:MAG: hypothetical protein IMW98_04540 [Firmicutes bacterium]|nr:hypothetical protein [Bacillota bacterium]